MNLRLLLVYTKYRSLFTSSRVQEYCILSLRVCTQEERSQVRDLLLAHSSEVGQLRGCIKEACILIRTITEVPRAGDSRCKAGSLDQLESAELIRRLSGELQTLVASLRDGRWAVVVAGCIRS